MAKRKVQQVTYEEAIAELRALQRKRTVLMKSRIMIGNALVSNLAVADGYHSGLTEKERKEKFEVARALIEDVLAGRATCDYEAIIHNTKPVVDEYEDQEQAIEKLMLAQIRCLPIRDWVEAPEQRGLGLLSVAKIIGEAGDLCLYSNPAKLWKRFGLAPYAKGDKCQMGSTWKRQGGLSGEDWTEFGYAPRRRSVIYVISECLLKSNKGPYRQRYDKSREMFDARNPDAPKSRSHKHGMLCAVKLCLRNLWIQWNRFHNPKFIYKPYPRKD